MTQRRKHSRAAEEVTSKMSRYVGWDEAGFERVRESAIEGDLHISSNSSDLSTQTLRSFTPININGGNMTVVDGGAKARSRGLDGDKLFDLPDDPLPAPPGSKRMKKMTKTSAVPKKRLSARLSHPWPKANEKRSSQLITSPDSGKRSINRLPVQMELFSGVSLTKASINSPKLITTETILRAGSVSLGQTTMEKLASFRQQTHIRVSPDTNSYGVLRDVEEPEIIHETRHSDISIEREISCLGVDSHDAKSCKEDHSCAILEGCSREEFNNDNPYDDFDDEILLEYDEGLIMVDRADKVTSQGIALPFGNIDSEDEFPLDDDLANAMVELSMPNKSHDNFFLNSSQYSPQNQNLQCRNIDQMDYQKMNASPRTLVSNDDSVFNTRSHSGAIVDSEFDLDTITSNLDESSNWPSIIEEEHDRSSTATLIQTGASPPESYNKSMLHVELDDYSPLEPFARPPFPSKVPDKSPIIGVSSKIILRTCFRIGEALREGAFCGGLGQDAIIELFARVTESSHLINPSKIHFEFADIFHDRPPFMRGTLEASNISCLQDTESRMLFRIDGLRPMARCLGRLKRVISGTPEWVFHIVNIRPTDWEEIRWTKQIAGAGMVK